MFPQNKFSDSKLLQSVIFWLLIYYFKICFHLEQFKIYVEFLKKEQSINIFHLQVPLLSSMTTLPQLLKKT